MQELDDDSKEAVKIIDATSDYLLADKVTDDEENEDNSNMVRRSKVNPLAVRKHKSKCAKVQAGIISGEAAVYNVNHIGIR